MTTGQDTELRSWMQEWQAERETPLGVREIILRRVRRQSFYQKAFAAGEIAVMVVMTSFLAWFGFTTRRPVDVVLVVAFLILQAWAVVYGFRARRGLWRARDESAAAFLDLSLRRCAQRLKLVRAGYAILAVEVAVFVPWIWVRTRAGVAPGASWLATRPGAYAFLAVFVAVALAAIVYVARRTRADLSALGEMKRALDGANGGS